MGIEEEEKWAKHYSSNHQILLVGDGDFSFSLSLALSFGSASNIVASSLDSYVDVITKYKDAESNLKKLEELGAAHLHGLDATKMKLHSDLKMRKFDRIIFNFPHAGFCGKEDDVRLIKKHKKLVQSFFANARGMLRADGEIHVNHKTKPPFCCWNLEELAAINSLALVECVDFKKEDYPGYSNKRGDGSRCNSPFHLGKCSTFMFRFFRSADKLKVRAHICSRDEVPYQHPQLNEQHVPFQMDRSFEQPREAQIQMNRRPLFDLSNLMDVRSYQPPQLKERHVPFQMDKRFEQPREAQIQMNRRPLSDLSNLMDVRSYQPHEPSFGFNASLSNSPLCLRDQRPYLTQKTPSRMQHPSALLGVNASMSNTSLYLRDGRSYQPQEDPYQMEYPFSSFGPNASMSKKMPFPMEMQPPVSSFGIHPSMSDIRYCQPQEAPLRMKYPSAASFDSDTSARNIPFHLQMKISQPPVVRYQMQERPSLFDHNARNIPVSDWLLRSQLHDRDSWVHGRTGGCLTYPVRDRGPNLQYERFVHDPHRF